MGSLSETLKPFRVLVLIFCCSIHCPDVALQAPSPSVDEINGENPHVQWCEMIKNRLKPARFNFQSWLFWSKWCWCRSINGIQLYLQYCWCYLFGSAFGLRLVSLGTSPMLVRACIMPFPLVSFPVLLTLDWAAATLLPLLKDGHLNVVWWKLVLRLIRSM